MNKDISKLGSINEHGEKLRIIPAEVRGFFRKHRDWTQLVLIFIFLAIPWTEINGHQTILLDIPHREFTLFGVIFRAYEAPLIFFLLIGATISLAFITSIWGRIWCGWACPQTVFIDAIYRRIEQLVEGNYIQRRQLRDGPMTGIKAFKLIIKWILFFIVSSLIAHSFAAYFIGSHQLIDMITDGPSAHMSAFLIVGFFTAITLFDFAWFREQFCVIMCPYGRIQSVLMDQKSLAVVYDAQRGEPRKGSVDEGKKQGDCVSCNRCVQVCPTAIDIRQGVQMECIACTACIDACDEIMDKVKKPRGLIKYDTVDGTPTQFFKPRTIAYLMIILVALGGLIFNLTSRTSAHYTVLRGIAKPFEISKDNQGQEILINHFRIHLTNQGQKSGNYLVSLSEDLINAGAELTAPQNPVRLDPGVSHTWHFFIKIKPEAVAQEGKMKGMVTVTDLNSPETFKVSKELTVIGPKK